MNAEHFHEAQAESVEALRDQLRDRFELTRREAEKVVADQLNNMTKDGRAVLMSDEEDRMIRAFRRFKANVRKDGEVFKWQTTKPLTGVAIETETALIRDPQEVA